MALAVAAGIKARPLICGCEPQGLPTRNAVGHLRGEGMEVEIVSGLLALDCRAWWAVPDSSGKWIVRVLLLLAAATLAGVTFDRFGIQSPLRLVIALWFAAAIGMAWDFVSEARGTGREWHEFLLVRIPFSNYRDGFSDPLSLPDVYLTAVLALLVGHVVLNVVRRRAPQG